MHKIIRKFFLSTPAYMLMAWMMLNLSACSGPLGVIGMVGSTVAKTIENAAEREETENGITQYPVSQPYDREEIAIANLNLGMVYMQQGEYRLALDKLERARIAKPDYAPTFNVLGLLYQRLGKNDEAEGYFQHSLKLDEDNSLTLNNYGQFLCAQQRIEEADKHFLAAAENPLYKTPEIPYTNIGTCAYLHDQPDKARDYFEKALALNPAMAVALIRMSEMKYESGDYPDARDYLNRYLKNATHTPRSLWLGIRIERELGNKDTLSSYALLLRNKYPDSDEAKLLAESGIR